MYLFTGRGVRLEPRKAASLSKPVRGLPLCGLLAVPLYTLGKTKLELTAGVGGKVAKFAPLALSRSRGHAILAPVSGRIRGGWSRWSTPCLEGCPARFWSRTRRFLPIIRDRRGWNPATGRAL